jgi:hypothetical protein
MLPRRKTTAGRAPDYRGVIGQLKDLLGLGRHRAKTLSGLPARLAAKVALYTCGQQSTTK